MAIVKTDRHLDWLSITLPIEQNWRQFLSLRDIKLVGRGRHGYRHAYKDTLTGVQVETGADDNRMGHHFTITGDNLVALRQEMGATDDGIVKQMERYGAKCTRVDLAIDCYGAKFTPDMLAEALENGSAKIPAREWRFIDGHNSSNHGTTVDTGSPKSDRRLRFYDKNAEQKIRDGEAWVRLELQLRRLYALAAIDDCLATSCSQATTAQCGAYLVWSDTEYQSVIAGNTLCTSLTHRKQTKRQKWLLSQVAVAMATECYETPGFMDKFLAAVGYFTEKIEERERKTAQKLDQD